MCNYMPRKFYNLYNMTINLTMTPFEYALACLGAAALGKTLDVAIVQAQVSVTVQQSVPTTGKEC